MFNQGTVFVADWVLNLNNRCILFFHLEGLKKQHIYQTLHSFLGKKTLSLACLKQQDMTCRNESPGFPDPEEVQMRHSRSGGQVKWRLLVHRLAPNVRSHGIEHLQHMQHPVQTNNTQYRHATPSTDMQHPAQTRNTQYRHATPSTDMQHPVQTNNTQYRHAKHPVQTRNTQYRHTTPNTDNPQCKQTTPSTDTQHPAQTHNTQYRHTTPSTDNPQCKHTTPTQHPVQTHNTQCRHTTPSTDKQHPVQTNTLLTVPRHSMS